MRILVVHPEMRLMGGGERLCCETLRALTSRGHNITLLGEQFDWKKLEEFFGYEKLFDRIHLLLYPPPLKERTLLGSTANIAYHARRQHELIKREKIDGRTYDLLFSTQDPSYIPSLTIPVIQWGLFPRRFPSIRSGGNLPKVVRTAALRAFYRRRVSRIGLVLAISNYSKEHLDKEWDRPSALIYPPCNMVAPRPKRKLVVTVARASPEKRLELFWKTASRLSKYEFAMLVTQDSNYPEYLAKLVKEMPSNGKLMCNPPKSVYHDFLGEAKVYLHLMEGEHFGITIVEAMSASCVPVVHDSGGPKEIITEDLGFFWRKIEEIPELIERAMKSHATASLRQRAEIFNYGRFEGRFFEVISGLQARNPLLSQLTSQ